MHKQGHQRGAESICFLLEIPAYFAFHQNSFCTQRYLKSRAFNFFSSFSRSKCLDLFEVTKSLMSFNLASTSFFVTRLLISGILFSTTVNAKLVARPVILGILSSTSLTLPLKSVIFKQIINTGDFIFTCS